MRMRQLAFQNPLYPSQSLALDPKPRTPMIRMPRVTLSFVPHGLPAVTGVTVGSPVNGGGQRWQRRSTAEGINPPAFRTRDLPGEISKQATRPTARGTKMPNEYQLNNQKTLEYAPEIYNDPNMSEELKEIYRTLEKRFVHEGRAIDTSFYQDIIG
ncbi:hypothetical protein Tco_0327885 [Tanacetum coccineum]